MTYYPDLSPYEYVEHDQPMLNVGWLDRSHPFPTGDVEPEVLATLLRWAASFLRAILRGVQDCHFCDEESPLRVAVGAGRHTYVGMGEIRVESEDGTIYAAPSLVCHDVKAHRYLPPQEFLEAVRTGSPAPPEAINLAAELDPASMLRTARTFRAPW